MPFARPTLSDLIARSRGDLQSRLPGADAGLRHSVLDVLARTHAGAAAGLYGYLDWLARQLMPDTAEAEHLARWAAIWGIRRKAAIPAAATVTLTGVNGSVLPAGTELQRIDGAAYRAIAAATIVDGTASVAIEAVDAGPQGDLLVAAQLTLSTPVAGINATATVAALTTAGAAEEGDAALLDRLLARIRQPPQGGAKHDYIAWALAQPGVTRAWCWPEWMGPGTVGVSFVMDDREDPLPLPADIDAVAAALDVLRPVTAELYVFAPVASPVDVVLRIDPDTPETRAAIEAELEDFFTREGEPGGIIHRSRISEAVSLAQGEFAHTLDLPDRDLQMPPGEIATLGTVSWAA